MGNDIQLKPKWQQAELKTFTSTGHCAELITIYSTYYCVICFARRDPHFAGYPGKRGSTHYYSKREYLVSSNFRM